MESLDDSSSLPPSRSFSCTVCDAKFVSSSGLWKHNKNLHQEIAAAKTRQPKLTCGLCEAVSSSQRSLCKHLSEVHSIKADVQTSEFESMDDFDKWKKMKEEQGQCQFTKDHRETLASGTVTVYYYCHRSGSYESKSKGVRAPRHHVTNRCGFRCSAFMVSKTSSNGRVEVSYCLDHYGHDRSVSRLALPDSTREQVKTYLMEERSADWIIKNARGNFRSTDNVNRGQMLKKSDVFNIQRACGLRKAEKHPNQCQVPERSIIRETEEKCRNVLTTLSGQLPNLNDATLLAINMKLTEIATLLKLSSTNAGASTTLSTPALSEEAGPSNKGFKRQRRV